VSVPFMSWARESEDSPSTHLVRGWDLGELIGEVVCLSENDRELVHDIRPLVSAESGVEKSETNQSPGTSILRVNRERLPLNARVEQAELCQRRTELVGSRSQNCVHVCVQVQVG